MPAGNDFCNQELYNARAHNVDGTVVDGGGRPSLRGIPAVGKVVYRTDLGALEVCSAETPNADRDGGGTWRPVSRPISSTWSVDVYQGGATSINNPLTVTELLTSMSVAHRSGLAFVNGFVFTDSVGGVAPTAASPIYLEVVSDSATDLVWGVVNGPVGTFTYFNNNTNEHEHAGIVWADDGGGGGINRLHFVLPDGTELGSLITVNYGSSTDFISLSLTIPFLEDDPVY